MQKSPKHKFGQAIKLVRDVRRSADAAKAFQASKLADKVWSPVHHADGALQWSVGNPEYRHPDPRRLTEIQVADLRARNINPHITPIIGVDTDSTCANVLRYYL